MVIKVLGPGCKKCHETENVVKEAIAEAGVQADLVHVTDTMEIAQHGVFGTPAVVVDGEVKSARSRKRPMSFLGFHRSCDWTGNSCRSQMAEGWTRHLRGGTFEAFSTGIDPKGIDSRAVRAMAQAGVDISTQESKSIDQLTQLKVDHVVTLCSHARENCPFYPTQTALRHILFDDPPRLAKGAETEEEAMAHYRRVRDQIRLFVKHLPMSLGD